MNPPRVVFAGTSAFAIPSLRALLDGDADVVGVYTVHDRDAGRGRKPRASAVKIVAAEHGLPIYQPASLRDEVEFAQLQSLAPDLIVVVAYGLLLPREIISLPPLGCVNLHASLLPRWRGAAPIARAIEAGDRTTGVTLMRIAERLDCGAVLAQTEMPITTTTTATVTAGTLHDQLATRAGELLRAQLPSLAANNLTPREQDESLACYAAKLTKAEARLDWRLPATVLERKVRAFNPVPVAVGELDGMPLRIFSVTVDNTDYGDAPAGEILRADKNGIAVAAGDGALVLSELQKPGGVVMAAAALLNGMTVTRGMRFTVPD